jgi:hypothetical protein
VRIGPANVALPATWAGQQAGRTLANLGHFPVHVLILPGGIVLGALIRQGGAAINWIVFMAEAPYLIALALVEIGGKRALPLNGKSQTAGAAEASVPGDDGCTLALELLLRLWQRSDDGPMQRAGGESSLLLVELPLEVMSEQLPLLKANWLAGGETATLLSSLKGLATRAWRITIAKYEPITFIAWP